MQPGVDVVIIHTLGSDVNRITEQWTNVLIITVEPPQGVAPVIIKDQHIKVITPARMKVRGSTSARSNKKQWAIETADEEGNSKSLEMFGMPAESDWILYSTLQYDKAWIRSAFVYEMSRKLFNTYASRIRPLEVFLVANGELDVSHPTQNFWGFYYWLEKIKRDKDRVDVDSLTPADKTLPKITGGYVFKVDRSSPDKSDEFFAATYKYVYVYPDVTKINTEQKQYLTKFLTDFKTSVNNATGTAPDFLNLIKIKETIDYHLVRSFSNDPDAFMYSTYLYKDRSGKFSFGPQWDYDRGFGGESRSLNPLNFTTTNWDRGIWRDLWRQPQFVRRYVERYWEIRSTFFNLTALHKLVDDVAAPVKLVANRNIARWYRPSYNYQSEVDNLKRWITARLNSADVLMCYTNRPNPPCNDKNPCTAEVCNPRLPPRQNCISIQTECDSCNLPENQGAACNDANACTSNDKCLNGRCIGTSIESTCTDNLYCTLNTCDVAKGCQTSPLKCNDDGIFCTQEICNETAKGCLSVPDHSKCDDNNKCTVDLCDPKSGCTHRPIVCPDSRACNPEFGCVHLIFECHDDNVCTTDIRTPTGCEYKPVVCDDNDLCTEDTCGPNGCVFSPKCDDGDDCTEDSCDPKTGCQHRNTCAPGSIQSHILQLNFFSTCHSPDLPLFLDGLRHSFQDQQPMLRAKLELLNCSDVVPHRTKDQIPGFENQALLTVNLTIFAPGSIVTSDLVQATASEAISEVSNKLNVPATLIETHDESPELSAGAISGIVIGCVVGFLALTLTVAYVVYVKKVKSDYV